MKALEIIKLSSSECDFRQLLTDSLRIPVDRLEYRTTDEGLCSAEFFICKKNKSLNAPLAFTALINQALHFYEEWNINDTQAGEIDLIAQKWLLPTILKAKDISTDLVSANISWVTEAIEKCIHQKTKPGNLPHPGRWGVFLNNEPFLPAPRMELLSITGTPIALANEWNEMEFFYETSRTYNLFSWGTSA